MFGSHGHAAEHVLVLSLPDLVYLVVTHPLRHTVTDKGLSSVVVITRGLLGGENRNYPIDKNLRRKKNSRKETGNHSFRTAKWDALRLSDTAKSRH